MDQALSPLACPLKSAASLRESQAYRFGAHALSRVTMAYCFGLAGASITTGPPDFFQAPKPPSIWETGFSPMRCAVCVASAERRPPAQKKTYFLSWAKAGL